MNPRLFLVLPLLLACRSNEYSDRSQFITVSDEEEKELGRVAYQEMLAQSRISEDPREIEPVLRVGRRLQEAAARPDFDWEYSVIVDDRMVNAWALPGGKIAAYTGIYPALQDDAGLALVLGHELAHALARHAAERMSRQNLGGPVRGLVRGVIHRIPIVRGAVGLSLGILAGFPFSRLQESEADAIGLKLMAKAGYDPRVSTAVWKRLEEASGGGPPEVLSTHPSFETRSQNLLKLMDEAVAIYEKSERAPVLPLPSIQGERRTSPRNVPSLRPQVPDYTLKAKVVAVRRASIRLGVPALEFGFTLSHDAFVERTQITGPNGLTETPESGAGVLRGDELTVEIRRPTRFSADFHAGTYRMEISGATGGRSFSATALFVLTE